MISETDIQIGDWLHLEYTNSIDGFVSFNFKVSQLRRDYGDELLVWGEKTPDGKHFGNMGGVSKIQPIPLTAEILEKNGFKIVHGFGYSESYPTYGWGYHKGLRDYASVDVTFYDEPIGGVSRLVKMETASKKDDGINSIHSCDIEFIHQLQHALKLAGIEKEITI